MLKIGILIVEDTPDNKPTLEFFKQVEKKYNAKTVVIEAKNISYLYSKDDFINRDTQERKYINYNNKILKLDAIIPKIDSGASAEDFLLAINIMDYIRNHTSIVVINYTKGMLISNDKFWQSEYIASHGYLIPKTAFITSRDNIDSSLANFKTYPLIVKNQYGAGGSGVAIVESERSAKSVIGTMISNKSNVVVQEYLPVKGGTDYRVYVIGGKAVKGIIRTAPEKEFRANVALGGSKKSFNPDKQLSAMAVEIANLVGLEIAAVDFMYYNDKYYFIEINKNPGTKKDLKTSEKMLAYVVDRCKKKVQKVLIPKKRYLIKNLQGVIKVFNDLNYDFFGVGVKSFDCLAPAFFIERYGILAYRYTNDLKLLRQYAKVKSMEDPDQDYLNYHSSLKYPNEIEYAKVENYLHKFLNPTLFVYDTNPQVEKLIEYSKTNVVKINQDLSSKKYQNKFYFSSLLNRNKINALVYENFEIAGLLKMTYHQLTIKFGKLFNVYLSGKNLKYVRKIFYISSEKDLDNFKKTILDVSYPAHEIKDVYICRAPKGLPISVNACITQEGTLVNYPSVSLLDISQVNSKIHSRRSKYCGAMWGKDLKNSELLAKIEKLVKKIGNILNKNNNYRGLFNLDLRYNLQTNEMQVVGFNTRPSGSLVVEDLARCFAGEIPLQAFGILESLNINYNFDFQKFARQYKKQTFNGTNLYLFNRKNKEIQIKNSLKPGIYEFSNNKIKFVKDALNILKLKKNQFLVIESIASVDRTIVLDDDKSQILGLIFPEQIYEYGFGLKPTAIKIVESVYRKLGI